MRIYIIVSIFLCPFFQRLEHYIQGVRLKLRFVVIYNKKMVVAHHMQSQGMYHYPMGDTCPKRYDCIFWVVFLTLLIGPVWGTYVIFLWKSNLRGVFFVLIFYILQRSSLPGPIHKLFHSIIFRSLQLSEDLSITLSRPWAWWFLHNQIIWDFCL